MYHNSYVRLQGENGGYNESENRDTLLVVKATIVIIVLSNSSSEGTQMTADLFLKGSAYYNVNQ
jgi:hypothetical protein